ncbi:hypothetical protein [Streptomyces sp. YGL11-2]|uniref:hypothetical protein n=1 Tax=Streptomyces sp. YGL11-2 TaxID=3414028 RepID=UPI003CE9003C
MSEARTDTTQARPQGTSAQAAEAAGAGKHRGQASSSEEAQAAVHGRHRRDHQAQTA